MEEVYIYTCPNDCHAGLTCKAQVTQTWSVNLQGEPVTLIGSEEPDYIYETPCCAKCGAVTDENACLAFPVISAKGVCLGTVYISTDNNTVAWYKRNEDPAAERVTLKQARNTLCVTLDGVCYYIDEDSFTSQEEVEGQLSLPLFHLPNAAYMGSETQCLT